MVGFFSESPLGLHVATLLLSSGQELSKNFFLQFSTHLGLLVPHINLDISLVVQSCLRTQSFSEVLRRKEGITYEFGGKQFSQQYQMVPKLLLLSDQV